MDRPTEPIQGLAEPIQAPPQLDRCAAATAVGSRHLLAGSGHLLAGAVGGAARIAAPRRRLDPGHTWTRCR